MNGENKTKVSKAEERRIKKYANMPLKEFSTPKAVLKMIFYPPTSFWSIHFTMTTVRKFFLLQHKQKWGWSHYPVINVESPLDEKVPFDPEKIYTYMDFSAYFCRPMGMLYKRLGMFRSIKISNMFFKFLTHEYHEAYKVYTYCMTTTNRPDYEGKPQFVKIHKTDPHFLCVPSLHCTIAAGAWAFFRKYLPTVLPKEEAEARIAEIRELGIAIIESVLFVKQHSVNCVPSALYMLTATTEPDFFPVEDALGVINVLFQNSPEIDADTKKELRDYFEYIYERDLLLNSFEDSWEESIKCWLREHAETTNQTQLLEKTSR